tara:strand:+ start:95 stop:826 length:732 start_codon:yes stop_codon:yes gene_type:complete
MFDPDVQKYKTVVMQRIQQAASRGYIYYTSGEIPLRKATNLANKFAVLYEIDANENRRSYKKRKGEANGFLYLFPKKNSDNFHWWLMATEGTGDIHNSEKLIKIFDKHNRLNWNNDYELLLVPKINGKHSISWRMTRKCYQEWNDRIRKSIRQRYNDDKAKQAIWSLSRAPGFSGIREQVKNLYKLYAGEWKRSRKQTGEAPKLPPIGYVRGLKSETIPLSLMVSRLKKGLRPFPRTDSNQEA